MVLFALLFANDYKHDIIQIDLFKIDEASSEVFFCDTFVTNVVITYN